MTRVAVVGAGMAGLTAARTLHEAGVEVTVFDKGRSVGGRLATRRIGRGTFDHGAQFFTVRTGDFESTVAAAIDDGVVFEWCRGFGPTEDGHPRYATDRGMNQLAKHLEAGIDISVGTTVEGVDLIDRRWRLAHGEASVEADAVVLTPPVPQSLALLDAGGVQLDRTLRARLDATAYHPTLAVMALLDRSPAVPEPGGVQLTDGPFGFVADNQRKGISQAPALTLHASHAESRARWDDDHDATTAELLERAEQWIGQADVVEAQLKRWRYAAPTAPADHEYEAANVAGAPLVFAGDAFAGAKVEGAFRSGRAAARHVLAVLGNQG